MSHEDIQEETNAQAKILTILKMILKILQEANNEMETLPNAIIIPDMTLIKFKWTDTYTYSGSGSASGMWINIIGNSPYAPDASGNPSRGLRAWANFYQSMTCFASKINIRAINLSLINALEIGMFPSEVDQLINGTQLSAYFENPYVRWKYLAVSSSGSSNKTLTHYMSRAKLFGKDKRAIIMDPNWSSGMLGSPVAL